VQFSSGSISRTGSGCLPPISTLDLVPCTTPAPTSDSAPPPADDMVHTPGPSNDAIETEGDKVIRRQHLAVNTDTIIPAPPDSTPQHLEANNIASISASQRSSALEFTTSTNLPIEQPQLHTRLQAGVHKSKLYTLVVMFIMVALLN
jgi:hypothetical protein